MNDQAQGNIYKSNMRTSNTKRELSLDILRGIAVISMIITHAVAFFYNGGDPLVINIGVIGGIISFTMFLFISGAASYIGYVRYDSKTEGETLNRRRRQIITRSIGLLIGYYLIATIASIPTYSFPPNITWIENIARTVFLNNVPEFTEFILAFVIFGLIVVPLRRFYKFSLRFPPFLIAVAIGVYLLGQVLSPLVLTDTALFIKSLFVGNNDWHRFPIFQYFIVYAIGMIWGKFLINHPGYQLRIRINFLATAAFTALTVAGLISFSYLNIPILDPLQRFTPSLTFIAIGLAITYSIFLGINVTNHFKFLGFGQVFIHYLGSKAFNLFIFHTILLYVYKYLSGDRRIDSTIIFFVMFIVVLVLSAVVSAIKDWIVDNLKEEAGVEEGFGWIFSERVIVISVWILIIFLGGLAVYQSNKAEAAVNPDQVLFKKRLIREQDWPFWWDHNYNFFKQVTIATDSGLPILKNTWYSIGFDHKSAVSKAESQPSGADIRIVYYSEENGFIELPLLIDGIGASATIKFKLQEDILPGEPTDRYFIYYGNPTATSYPVSKETPASVANAGVKISDTFRHRINGSTNRRWVIKGGSVTLQQRTLLYTVQLDATLKPDSLVSYSVDGTNARGLMDNLGGGKYQAAINVSDITPGVYKVQAVAREQENKLKLIESGFTTFYVSHPLYVVWTQDWEGWDVPDSYLNEIDAFSQRHGLVMTHFFNPRIFLPTVVPKARADRMTLWVQDRAKNHNDEIGLHLHMWFDMVRAAGVTPRSTDYAGWLYGDGGGVAAYTYPVDEMKKILNWSRRVFQDNGLPTPISFRAGGWLAKANTLQALEETGFLIDSSGRTIGGQDSFTAKMKSLAPPWNLSPTQRPYKPNKTDINLSTSPQMNIWEFPNNGADSIWYNEVEMIKRFDLNYPDKGQILKEPQVITYLSHPPFWGVDKPRVEALFSYIDNFLYKNDRGPVIYTTLENAYYSWDRN